MHGVRQSLLEKQAKALGLPLSILSLPNEVSMEDYDSLMREKLESFMSQGVTHSAFGDIFLEDLKNYRVEKLSEVGLSGLFPIWNRDTTELYQEFVDLGFRSIVVAVDGSKLGKTFVGRELDESFLRDLPSSVDPCGENGEYHSFVFAGPIFDKEIRFEKGEIVSREYKLSKEPGNTVTYWFQDLIDIE